MSIARLMVPGNSSRPTSSARSRYCRRRSAIGAACCRIAVLGFRFLHISTDEVFGSLGEDGYFTETTSYAPNSPYSASKASSDHLVRAWHETHELPTLVTNCSNNYGPYHFPEKLIPHMIIKGRRRAPAGLRRRKEHSRLALCRRSRQGTDPRARARRGRRNVQCWRPKRAHQPARGRNAFVICWTKFHLARRVPGET